MAITSETVLEQACRKYRELCQRWLANREADWPTICREKSQVDLVRRMVILRSPEGRYLRRYYYRRVHAMWEPELCRECQKPIRDCYMLKDELWRQAGYGPLDLVCPGCLAKKLGRPLHAEDFQRWNPYPSARVRWLRRVRRVSEPLRKALRYAGRRLLGAEKVVGWSHARRFRLGRNLVEPYAGRRFLDYGCGDGSFLAFVHDLFPVAVGTDVDPGQINYCAKRFSEAAGLTFVLTDELVETRHAGTYGVVVCMDVLEHCLEEDWDTVLRDLARLASPSGVIIISVPVETGPSLIGKQFVRALAARCGLDDYKHRETYTIAQFWNMVFADERTAIERPVYRVEGAAGRRSQFHGHKGFNWRKLRARLEDRLDIERTCFSPLGWAGGYLNSQAWFVCKRR